ncbi:hypothetical protein QCB49_06235 [Cetobacterium somerae]|uniref:hypothetical protein n=1 Tax=Cetobacterium somerae TaxID=188913 RepID=UPI00389171F5
MKNFLLLFLIIFSTGILAQEIENNEKQTQEEYIKGRILYLESTKKVGIMDRMG